MLLYLTLYSILSITHGGVVEYGDGGPDYHSSTPLGCIALHCAIQSAQCIIDRVCFQTLQCMTDCEGKPDMAQCQFECEMTLGIDNTPFLHLLQTMAASLASHLMESAWLAPRTPCRRSRTSPWWRG